MNLTGKMLLAVIAVILCAVMSGCADQAFAAPPASYATAIPQLDIYQLQLDYSKNVAAADALYAGKRFYFGLVRAENTSSIFDVRNSEDYIIVNNIKFKPRATADTRGIIQGTVFEVIGDVQGVQGGFVIVKNCWFRIQSGGSTFAPGGAY